MYLYNRKFLLTKPMHMGAEDSGICHLHAVTEDAVSTGFGMTSGNLYSPSG